MKALIVYDSVSPNRNTEKIARAVGEALRERGFEVNCLSVHSAGQTAVMDYDVFMVGSPTMGWSATAPIKQFLERLDPKDVTGKMAAAFDTRVQSRFSGQAVKGIQERFERRGFRIIISPLVAYVEGGKRKNEYVLKEGELDKAKKYADDLSKAVGE